jgi:PAS domain S-box-containing protein
MMQREDAMRGSHQLSAAVFTARHVGMVKIDPRSRRFLAVNAAFCGLCGYDEAALLGMTVDLLSRPGDAPGSRPLADLVDDVPTQPAEQRLMHRDGREVWVVVDGGAVGDGVAGATEVLAIVQDVTARRLAEAALRAREARHAFLLRLNDRLRPLAEPLHIIELATGLLCDFCGASRVGYAEDDGNEKTVTLQHNHVRGVARIEGRHHYKDYDPALLRALRKGRTVVRPDIASDSVLTAREKRAHDALAVAATVNVPLLKAGHLIAVFFVHANTPRDWTSDEVALFEDVAERIWADLERVRAEARMLKAKAQLEAALESMVDAVCIANEHGEIVDFNWAFVRFHGYASKSEMPRKLEGLAGELDVQDEAGQPVPVEQWPVKRALRGETASDVEFWLQRKGSAKRWVASCSFAPIRGETGGVVGVVVCCRDITAVREMQAALHTAHMELQQLVAARDQAQEAERLRIACELHDELQQGLASIVIEAGAAAATPALDSATQGSLHLIADLAEEIIDATRRIIRDLRPQALEDLGLATALELLARQFTQRTRIPCTVDVKGLAAAAALDDLGALGTTVYRIAQEALNNVAKHAQARSALVSLSGGDGLPLRLAIADDGCGWPTDKPRPPEAYGLIGIRERVRSFGGQLTIASSPGQGTRLEIELPLAAAGPARPG